MATHFPALPFTAPLPTSALTHHFAGGSVSVGLDSRCFSPQLAPPRGRSQPFGSVGPPRPISKFLQWSFTAPFGFTMSNATAAKTASGNPIAEKLVASIKGRCATSRQPQGWHRRPSRRREATAHGGDQGGPCWLPSGTRRLRLFPEPSVGDVGAVHRPERDGAIHGYRLQSRGSLHAERTADEPAHDVLLPPAGPSSTRVSSRPTRLSAPPSWRWALPSA